MTKQSVSSLMKPCSGFGSLYLPKRNKEKEKQDGNEKDNEHLDKATRIEIIVLAWWVRRRSKNCLKRNEHAVLFQNGKKVVAFLI